MRARDWQLTYPGFVAAAPFQDLDGFLVRSLAETLAGPRLHKMLSAQDFGTYKPHPKTYLGACESLGRLKPSDVAMVAAHLHDLAGARACGLRTVYVERPGKEAWSVEDERYSEAKSWVDVWIAGDEDGFVQLANKLGIPKIPGLGSTAVRLAATWTKRSWFLGSGGLRSPRSPVT